MKLSTVVNPIRIGLGVISKQLRVAILSTTIVVAVVSKKLTVDVGRFLLFKKFIDIVDLVDGKTIHLRKVISDSSSLSESYVSKLGKNLRNIGGLSDGEPYFLEDYVVDTVSYTDPIQVVKKLGKVVSDAGALSDDQPTKYFSKAIAHGIGATDDVNGVLPGDEQIIAFFKSLDQSFQAAEEFVRKVSYHRSYEDSYVVSETTALRTGKITTDLATCSSAGYLRMQSYTEDMTYFAEDYIGTARTF